jgi:phosphoglycerol transferase
MAPRRTPASRIRIGQYLLTAGIALLAATGVFHLWSIGLQYPLLQYDEDAISVAVGYKSIAETGWIFANPSLGAPDGAVWLDRPSSDALHLAIGWLLSFLSREPFLLYNLYYLGGFPLSAIAALAVLKRLRIPFYIALPGALAFAFLPFHLLRYHHLFLASYYIVPLALLPFLDVVDGKLSVALPDRVHRRLRINIGEPRFWCYALICVLAASSGIYYAFFIAFVGVVSAAYCLFLGTADARLSRLFSCLAFVLVVALTALVNAAPSFIYASLYGAPSQAAIVRHPAGAEVFGLKIVQMLLPSQIHRVPLLAGIARAYAAMTPLVNENATASLGLIGAVGFLVSLVHGLRFQRGNVIDHYLGVLNLASILLATIGGFGSALAFIILPAIRAYNRISVIVGFVSIAVFCRLLQHLVHASYPGGLVLQQKRHMILAVALSVSLLGLVVLDQCYYAGFMDRHRMLQSSFENDRRFARSIQNELPEGAMIFQLPFMAFPENGPLNEMIDYDHFRPYLHTSGLRWSYGAMRGTGASEWSSSTAALSAKQMLKRLANAGFSGIYIDRFGYPDHGAHIEAEIRRLLSTDPIVSDDGRFVFYDLGP